jgi:NADPH-dependent 2,4-dienoyl-CoA reductase/sulfur reductase-like enzyme
MTDHEYDVVVLGSGAAGLTAAIAGHDAGARVGLFEKAAEVGGTLACSGGMSDDALIEAFVDQGPGILRWLEDETPVEFYVVDRVPDYHAEIEGGKTQGGRSLECPPYPFAELGEWAEPVTVGYLGLDRIPIATHAEGGT